MRLKFYREDMKRRDFFITAGMTSLATLANRNASAQTKSFSGKVETAADLNNYLRSIYQNLAVPFDADEVIVGDPKTKIKKVATMWMPYFSEIKKAQSLGINVLIVHEPTFYTYKDLDPKHKKEYAWASQTVQDRYNEAVEVKKKFILDNGMAIIRCHDMLDAAKTFGIPFAFGRAIGLSEKDVIDSKTYYNLYKIKTDKAVNVARKIAKAAKKLGQPGVEFYGDENYQVSTIGIGTGAISSPLSIGVLNPDLTISITDTVRAWVEPAFAKDTGKPLIIFNHGATEESGMVELTEYLKQNVPSIDFTHFFQGCAYKWIS